MRYDLRSGITPVPEETAVLDQPQLELYTFEEAESALSSIPFYPILKRNLGAEKIQYCKAEMLPGCVIGTLVIPDKSAPLHDSMKLAYYLEPSRLILIDENGQLLETLNRMLESELLETSETPRFFFSFLESLI